jgi:hypothetical protein
MDEGYDKALDILHETINEIGRQGVTKSSMISALADLTVMLGLIIEGEAGTYAMIDNMKSRVPFFKEADPGDDNESVQRH